MRGLLRSGQRTWSSCMSACTTSKMSYSQPFWTVTLSLRETLGFREAPKVTLRSSLTQATSFRKCLTPQSRPRGEALTMRSISARSVFANSSATNSFFYLAVNITFALNASSRWSLSLSRAVKSAKYVVLKHHAKSHLTILISRTSD